MKKLSLFILCTLVSFTPFLAHAKRYNGYLLTVYKVKKGDTLYSISHRFNADPNKIKRTNNIRTSNDIYAGKYLVIQHVNPIKNTPTPPKGKTHIVKHQKAIKHLRAAVKHRPHKEQDHTSPQAKSAKTPIDPWKQVAEKQEARTLQYESHHTYHPKERIGYQRKHLYSTPSYAINTPPTSSSGVHHAFKKHAVHWQWPVRGKIEKTFSDNSPGIDIGGYKGKPITATADGTVVYSGEGIRGYGKLIILKHNDLYISTYAHNSKLFVHKDEKVRAGQTIALMGNSGSSRTLLHFEIRKNGKPVNPLKLLHS